MSEFTVWKSKFKNTYNIISDDFANDVSLEVTGDFKDEEEYKSTAELICKRLNATQQLKGQLSKYREVMDAIDKFETKRMYETCPDCWSDSLGCEEHGRCMQFKGRTKVQEMIDEVIATLEGHEND